MCNSTSLSYALLNVGDLSMGKCLWLMKKKFANGFKNFNQSMLCDWDNIIPDLEPYPIGVTNLSWPSLRRWSFPVCLVHKNSYMKMNIFFSLHLWLNIFGLSMFRNGKNEVVILNFSLLRINREIWNWSLRFWSSSCK